MVHRVVGILAEVPDGYRESSQGLGYVGEIRRGRRGSLPRHRVVILLGG
ncbi:MAG: hypothetical protein R3344_08905 [Acidobacteriota bacterium]|nr:hypothetical protein [Acidobacteriota bacterium]